MTLKEAFELMRPEHRPSLEMSKSGALWWVNTDAVGFTSTPDSLAESAICWAMVKAMGKCGAYTVYEYADEKWMAADGLTEQRWIADDPFSALAAAYAAAFPKEKA